MITEQGIYELTNDDYHADPALGHTGILKFLRNPLVYKHFTKVNETNTAFDVGTAFHLACLEPDLFESSVTRQPSTIKQRRGKAWDEFQAENADKIILKAADADLVAQMAASFERPQHSLARTLLNLEGQVEQSLFFIDKPTGVMCKARPDKRIHGEGIMVDLKSCRDASPEGFAKAVARYGYDVQAAFYVTAGLILFDQHYDFIFLAEEKEPPHCIGVHLATQEVLDNGRKKIRQALDEYANCLAADEWQGYPDEIVEINLPLWALV